MDRRSFVAVVGASALAGCSEGLPVGTSANDTDGGDASTPTPGRDGDPTATPASGLSVGESYRTDDAVRVTTVAVTETRTVATTDGTSLWAADDRVLVLVRLHVRNEAPGAQSLPDRRAFAFVADGEAYAPQALSGDLVAPVSGSAYEGSETVGADAERTGWLAFAVPERVGGGRLAWELADGGRPAWTVSIDPASIPAVSVDVATPDAVAVGSVYPAAVELTNEGDTEATVVTTLRFDQPGRRPIERTIDRAVPPARTVSVGLTGSAAAVGTARLSLPALERAATVDVEPAAPGFDETWSWLERAAMTVSAPTFDDDVIYDDPDGGGRVPAEEDMAFALVRVSVENVGDEPLERPEPKAFTATGGGATAVPIGLGLIEDGVLGKPVEGDPYRAPGEDDALPPGERRGGWMAFELPEGIDRVDVSVRMDWRVGRGDAATVVWG